MPKISVIIPLYNKAKYIARAINSVLTQTFKDYEIIVIDDGSTDNGSEVVKSFKNLKLKLITQKNSGPGSARNRGVSEAQSDYIAFLDADDEWLPDYLQEIFDLRIKHPDCSVFVSNWVADFSRHPKGLRNVNISDYMEKAVGVNFSCSWRISNKISTMELFNITSRFCTPATSCTKSTFLKYKGFGTDGKYGEDWFLWLHFIFNEQIFFIEKPLVVVHDEASGIWCGGAKQQTLELYFFKYDIIKNNCPNEYQSLLKKWFILKALQSAHNRLECSKFDDVQYLIKTFQLMQTYSFWSYIKLRLKILQHFVKKKINS